MLEIERMSLWIIQSDHETFSLIDVATELLNSYIVIIKYLNVLGTTNSIQFISIVFGWQHTSKADISKPGQRKPKLSVWLCDVIWLNL